jgi:arylsulfatase
VPLIFSIDETCDVGRDTGSSVTDEYTAASSEFSGTIEQARIELAKGAPDFRDLIDPEHRLAVALARQ